MYPLNDLVNVFKLIIDLLHNHPILLIQHLLILFHLHIRMLYAIQLLLQHAKVVFVVAGYVGYRVFARDYAVIFVDGAAVDAVDTKQFKLVLAVEGDKVVMDKAFLG